MKLSDIIDGKLYTATIQPLVHVFEECKALRVRAERMVNGVTGQPTVKMSNSTFEFWLNDDAAVESYNVRTTGN